MSGNGLFSFTDEHEMIRQAARDFAQKEIAPIAEEFDESGEFPRKDHQKNGGNGIYGHRGARRVRREPGWIPWLTCWLLKKFAK
jgi:alkylation response protein AidB-like acyl-CoA dehydrogenase